MGPVKTSRLPRGADPRANSWGVIGGGARSFSADLKRCPNQEGSGSGRHLFNVGRGDGDAPRQIKGERGPGGTRVGVEWMPPKANSRKGKQPDENGATDVARSLAVKKWMTRMAGVLLVVVSVLLVHLQGGG